MKPTELRIGNYVYAQSGKLVINRDSIYRIENINLQSARKYDPIPLTEEWLLKFGFKEAKNIIPIYDLGLISIYLESDSYPEGRVYFNSWCIIKKKPKYVHQLQNLYFALTGEEL